MKFLIRRIRYAFAGRIMRFVMAIFSVLVVGVFVILMLSGIINQKALFQNIFGWAWDSSENIANKVEEGNIPLDITNEGIYFEGAAPKGAEDIDIEKEAQKRQEEKNSKDNNAEVNDSENKDSDKKTDKENQSE